MMSRAPAAFTLQPGSLAAIKDMPAMIVQRDADNMVTVANTWQWVDKLKEPNMTFEYSEIPGGDHGRVMPSNNPGIYSFFSKHSKPAVN